jgi:cytochrome c
MKVQHAVMLTAGLMLANVAVAEDGLALMKKNNCVTCHQLEKKTVGPGIKMIAAKYKDDAGAVDKLVKKVRAGGSGNWGTMAMPPAPAKISDAELKEMVSAILAAK